MNNDIQGLLFFCITSVGIIHNLRLKDLADQKVETDINKSQITQSECLTLNALKQNLIAYDRILSNLNKNVDDPVSPEDASENEKEINRRLRYEHICMCIEKDTYTFEACLRDDALCDRSVKAVLVNKRMYICKSVY